MKSLALFYLVSVAPLLLSAAILPARHADAEAPAALAVEGRSPQDSEGSDDSAAAADKKKFPFPNPIPTGPNKPIFTGPFIIPNPGPPSPNRDPGLRNTLMPTFRASMVPVKGDPAPTGVPDGLGLNGNPDSGSSS